MYALTPESGVDISADNARPKGILLGSCWNPAITFNLDINRMRRRLEEAALILNFKGLTCK